MEDLFSGDELGMKYAGDWLSELMDEDLPVTYVPSGDMYRYRIR